MKPLQIGDECYVRVMQGMHKGKIWKMNVSGTLLINLACKRDFFRLVYPFPCVKELAV